MKLYLKMKCFSQLRAFKNVDCKMMAIYLGFNMLIKFIKYHDAKNTVAISRNFSI